MTGGEIPQELIDILDSRAGKTHSRRGSVVTCLAEILTRYDEIRGRLHSREEPSTEKGHEHR
jgi:hypothetical protein